MAKTRAKPAAPSRARRGELKAGPDGTPSADTIRQALDDLGINRPYYSCRVVGNRLELTLYGGDVVTWPPAPATKTRRRPPKKED